MGAGLKTLIRLDDARVALLSRILLLGPLSFLSPTPHSFTYPSLSSVLFISISLSLSLVSCVDVAASKPW